MTYASHKIWKSNWEYVGVADGQNEPVIYEDDPVQAFIEKLAGHVDVEEVLSKSIDELDQPPLPDIEMDYAGIITTCSSCKHEEDLKMELWGLCTGCDKFLLLTEIEGHISRHHSQI